MSLQRALLAVVLSLLSLSADAQSERILIPIHLEDPVAGAFGSRWISELRILNTGPEDVLLDDFGPSCPFACPGISLPPNVEWLASGLRNRLVGGAPAAVVRVSSATAHQLAFHLRVADLSRMSETMGTTLPVVQERDMSVGTVQLPGIPLGAQYRHMLRVYALNVAEGHTVTVRFYGTSPEGLPRDADPLLSELVVPLRIGPTSTQPPGYAEISHIESLPALKGHEHVRITVQPNGAFALWAMESITNNDTQQITIVVPNHVPAR